LGILVIVGGVGYVVDAVAAILSPNLGLTISRFTFIGELSLPLWLVFKGVSVEQWQRVAGTDGAAAP
jgi:hypothetical protein